MDPLKGELLLQTSIKRTATGVTITVKAHEKLEEAMKLLVPLEPGTQIPIPPRLVSDFGRWWSSSTELRVYSLPADMLGSNVVGTGRLRYRLDRPGSALEYNDTDPSRTPVINLSFLRLVGLKDGISFTISTVYSRDGMEDLCKKIEAATRQFYFQYLKPISQNVIIMTQEI